MLDLEYLLLIDAMEEPDYFGFYSPELENFTGTAHSIEDCMCRKHIICLPLLSLQPKIGQAICNKNRTINVL